MLNYRRTYSSDRIKIRKILDGNSMGYDDREPLFGFVAEEAETLDLIGFSYVHEALIIDPFACESPLAAMKLFYMTQGAASTVNGASGKPISNIVIQINNDNKRLLDEVSKLGFSRIENKYAIFKKVI